MARPPAKELTLRELEIMHYFWQHGEATIADVRDGMAAAGLDRAYTTVATLVRILVEKGTLEQLNDDRPFRFRAVRSHDEVAGRLLDDLVTRVFQGSREDLLMRLFDEKRLTAAERALLQKILKERRS
jgi:predicted transcriptional regulator